MDEDNVVIAYTHGGVSYTTGMVSKNVMNRFPGKVYIMTLYNQVFLFSQMELMEQKDSIIMLKKLL